MIATQAIENIKENKDLSKPFAFVKELMDNLDVDD